MLRRNERTRALEHHCPAVARLQGRERSGPICLDFGRRPAQQAPGLARVRCNHAIVGRLRLLCEEIQRIGIPHRRPAERGDALVKRARPVGLAQPRSEGDDVGALQQWLQIIGVGHAV